MYQHVFVAGTFDGFHAGHQAVLVKSFEAGERVTVGLTSDGFVARFKSQIPSTKSQTISKFKQRKQKLHAWLRELGYLGQVAIIPIDDPYEPAASMPDLDALIVTQENRERGEEINLIRKKRSLVPLMLIEVPMVAAEDGTPVSSTRMRNGEIDHNGRLIMPESLRDTLGKPLGKVLTGGAIERSIQRNSDKLIITVGDVATKTLLDAGVTPFLSIVDGKVRRRPYPHAISQLRKTLPSEAKPIRSGPGFISQEAIRNIRVMLDSGNQAIKMHHALIIDGEEDLLVLPAILHAPPGALLYYGQPPGRRAGPEVWPDNAGQAGGGLVEVWVNASMRKSARVLLKQFVG